VAEDLGAALNTLVLLAEQVNIDLPRSVQLKLQLNSRKYPASLVQGKADKYDSYRATTGFGKGSKQVGWKLRPFRRFLVATPLAVYEEGNWRM